MLRPSTISMRQQLSVVSPTTSRLPYSGRLNARQPRRLPEIKRKEAAKESFDLLEAFFIGRALAETINERLGTLAADALAEFGKLEAEIRRGVSEFENDVVERGRREMMIAISPDGTVPSTTAGSTPSISENAEFVPADIGEAVDNLRAEIASTRALVQQIRQKTISQP